MATREELQSLLERVEAATAASYPIETAVADLLTPELSMRGIYPNVTASIDAALGLLERALPGWTHGYQKFPVGEIFNSGGYQFFVAEDYANLDSGYASGEAPTLPLAALIATLRALIAQQGAA